jgi:hypothetical protein
MFGSGSGIDDDGADPDSGDDRPSPRGLLPQG